MFKLMIFDDFWKFSKKSGKMPKSDTFLGIWLYTKCVTFTHDSVITLFINEKSVFRIFDDIRETSGSLYNKKSITFNPLLYIQSVSTV